MRDVRAFLMDASVVRVDEGEDIQIDEFAVLLHTDDVDPAGVRILRRGWARGAPQPRRRARAR